MRRTSLPVLLGLLALGLARPGSGADAPAWLRAAAGLSLPSYPEETNAVMLLDEQVTTVTETGEIKTTYRRAYKVLRPEGRSLGVVGVPFDNDTKLTFLKAWSIPPDGKVYEVKEKDAIESGMSDSVLYSDNRVKVLRIPAAEPGHIIGYEYEQKRRPTVLQDLWLFQDPLPVRQARFVLQLPPGWEFETFWLNHPAKEPRTLGQNQWAWELENLPAIKPEPAMPAWKAVAGWLAVSYFSGSAKLQGKSHSTWTDVGRWYSRLSADRRQATPEIQQKVRDLVGSKTATLDKIRALAAFAQREVRYVAIEIGIGGYQPHAAADVFRNRYGDCKDKATVLSTMLRESGIDSYYVLINATRGVVAPQFASPMSFNHAILAIRLPDDVPVDTLFAVTQHPQLGRLLFFDPTDPLTPLGQLPPSLQANHGLLVTNDAGELVQLPLLPPAVNQLQRHAKLELTPTGTLTGEVQEVRSGSFATNRRSALLSATALERTKVLESFLASFLTGFTLTSAQVENLENYEDSLVLRYRFVAQSYAKLSGNLLLVRPRVVGSKGEAIFDDKPRNYPVEFDDATLQTDTFEIALPPGFQVDELPLPVELDHGVVKYASKTEVEGKVLRYQRTYQVTDIRVPTERHEDLKKFYRRITADERSAAVLKRAP